MTKEKLLRIYRITFQMSVLALSIWMLKDAFRSALYVDDGVLGYLVALLPSWLFVPAAKLSVSWRSEYLFVITALWAAIAMEFVTRGLMSPRKVIKYGVTTTIAVLHLADICFRLIRIDALCASFTPVQFWTGFGFSVVCAVIFAIGARLELNP